MTMDFVEALSGNLEADTSGPEARVSPTARRRPGVTVREITADDLPDIAALLHEGFPRQSERAFLAALTTLRSRPPVAGVARFGHMLQAGRDAVGVLLTIGQNGGSIRCNVSCWYVQPAYRLYASLLVLRTATDERVTFVNIDPAENTRRTIEAQGFRLASSGVFAGVPLLSRRGIGAVAHAIEAAPDSVPGISNGEMTLLRAHAACGCISLVCTAGGQAAPFVFRRRRFDRFALPCAQLVYCRDVRDVGVFANALGRALAMRGMAWLLAGGDSAIPAMPGRFFANKMPVYFKGPVKPRCGDLSFTEVALFGF
jgi:hypothetical protein